MTMGLNIKATQDAFELLYAAVDSNEEHIYTEVTDARFNTVAALLSQADASHYRVTLTALAWMYMCVDPAAPDDTRAEIRDAVRHVLARADHTQRRASEIKQ